MSKSKPTPSSHPTHRRRLLRCEHTSGLRLKETIGNAHPKAQNWLTIVKRTINVELAKRSEGIDRKRSRQRYVPIPMLISYIWTTWNANWIDTSRWPGTLLVLFTAFFHTLLQSHNGGSTLNRLGSQKTSGLEWRATKLTGTEKKLHTILEKRPFKTRNVA